jgi:hypothetical protein
MISARPATMPLHMVRYPGRFLNRNSGEALEIVMPPLTDASRHSRRQLITAGTLGLFGMSMPQLSAAAAASPNARSKRPRGKPKACILLFMWGGPGHQDT